MSIEYSIRRVRNLINDKPYGFSDSGQGFSTDITSMNDPSLDLAFGEGYSFINISMSATGMDTGYKIASALQTEIRASSPETNYALAVVTFNPNTGYSIKSGNYSSNSEPIVQPPSSGDDLSSALALGVANGGNEYLDPPPRHSDELIQELLQFALVQWNANAPDHLTVCSLSELEEPILTVVLYYTWMLLLEQDAGNTVYSFRQKLGGDELALTDVHRNILDLLKHLRDRIKELEEDLGVGTITVGTLTRYDRQTDMRFPTYIKTDIGHPIFHQLIAETSSSILIEWREVRIIDFAGAEVWLLDDPDSSPMVDKALLTNPTSERRANAIIKEAKKVREVHSPIDTVVRIGNLDAQKYNIVVVFRDTRGDYYWSDEYQVDLADPQSPAVLVHRNNRKSSDSDPDTIIC